MEKFRSIPGCRDRDGARGRDFEKTKKIDARGSLSFLIYYFFSNFKSKDTSNKRKVLTCVFRVVMDVGGGNRLQQNGF